MTDWQRPFVDWVTIATVASRPPWGIGGTHRPVVVHRLDLSGQGTVCGLDDDAILPLHRAWLRGLRRLCRRCESIAAGWNR